MARGHSLISRRYMKYGFCEKDIELSNAKMCVYFITDGVYVKIGIADNLKHRLSGLQTSNPRKLEVLCIIPCKSRQEMQKYEIKLHKRFSERQALGEWFYINRKDIMTVKEELNVEMYRVIEIV